MAKKPKLSDQQAANAVRRHFRALAAAVQEAENRGMDLELRLVADCCGAFKAAGSESTQYRLEPGSTRITKTTYF